METNKSLFPAYIESKNSDKNNEKSNELQYNWLTLESYDNQKIHEFQQKISEDLSHKSDQLIPKKKINKDNNYGNYL